MSKNYSDYYTRFTNLCKDAEWPSDKTAKEIFYRHNIRD